jgi:hypothetical protein
MEQLMLHYIHRTTEGSEIFECTCVLDTPPNNQEKVEGGVHMVDVEASEHQDGSCVAVIQWYLFVLTRQNSAPSIASFERLLFSSFLRRATGMYRQNNYFEPLLIVDVAEKQL